jgi:hypothetical protein
MTVKAFQARIIARLRRALSGRRTPIVRMRAASVEALELCGRHRADVPDRVVFVFERRYEDLWKTPEKRAIL